jgi:hypothetical protein
LAHVTHRGLFGRVPCGVSAGNRTIMEALWLNFNQVAEGFGLNLAVFQTICGNVEGLRVTTADCERIFRAFDSDKVTSFLSSCVVFLVTCVSKWCLERPGGRVGVPDYLCNRVCHDGTGEDPMYVRFCVVLYPFCVQVCAARHVPLLRL